MTLPRLPMQCPGPYFSLRLTVLLIFAIGIFATARAEASKSPQRVVSLNLCTDLLLMQVAANGQIAGLTNVAADPAYSPIATELGDTPLHDGRVEQIIALQADLILAPQFMLGAAQLLERLGYPVTRLDLPESLDGITAAITELGQLLGQQPRADAVVAEFDARRAAAGKLFDGQQALVVGPNRYTSGREGFKSSLLAAAGLTSASPFEKASALSLEQLIVTRPDILIIDDSTENQHSLAQSFKQHPALLKTLATGATRQLSVSSNNWLCASPYVANIWQQLASAVDE